VVPREWTARLFAPSMWDMVLWRKFLFAVAYRNSTSAVTYYALPGDAVIVMGLVMDGGVLWASELLSASAASAPAPAAESDPFNQPGL
jgi:hypothetical protein